MKGPIPVSAFACIVCSSLHKAEADADQCCRCDECGGLHPPREEGYRIRTCDRCLYSVRVKNARNEVERNAASLKSSQARLDALLRGRPPALPEARKRKFAPVEGESLPVSQVDRGGRS